MGDLESSVRSQDMTELVTETLIHSLNRTYWCGTLVIRYMGSANLERSSRVLAFGGRKINYMPWWDDVQVCQSIASGLTPSLFHIRQYTIWMIVQTIVHH